MVLHSAAIRRVLSDCNQHTEEAGCTERVKGDRNRRVTFSRVARGSTVSGSAWTAPQSRRTLRTRRRGDRTSAVKTNSGTAVATCTSCPAAIKCRTTCDRETAQMQQVRKNVMRLHQRNERKTRGGRSRNNVRGEEGREATSTARVAWPKPWPVR